MHYRVLGRTNFEVSDIGYGAWGIGGKQWLGGTDDGSLLALRRAIDLGVNLIDTALAYGDGHSERLVGDAVRATGRKIYVATKVPPMNRIWPAKSGTPISDVFPYDYLISSAEESLRNLRLETIDLLQLHVWTDEWVECDEWRRAFEDLKRSGKVQYVGVSATEHDPDSALAIMRTGLIDAVQVIYNIFDQTPEARLLPPAREMNIGTPEQLAGERPTSAVDVFAWGVTMIFAATGRPAFDADTVPAVMQRILYEEPDVSGLPLSLRPVVSECLNKDPARRASARDLLPRLVDPRSGAPRGGA